MRDQPALKPGTLIAQRYAIDTPLCMHGDGPVYRAVDRHLQRRVTLRTFTTSDWQSGARERFEADIRKATPLDHVNLAGIRDFGSDPALGIGYVVYEPLNGVTLAMFLARRHAPPPVAALQVMHDVAEGLGASHWAGLVHGELHPDTVFLAYSEVDRRVRVQLLLPGLPIGSRDGASIAARYAAPEVLRGEPGTPASDVYSLGVVAYELLVGLPARWDETVRGTLPREELDVPPANEIRPEISTEIAEAVTGALNPRPDQRFSDGNVFAIVLAYALDSAAAPRPATVFEGMPEFLRETFPDTPADLVAEPPAGPSAIAAGPAPAAAPTPVPVEEKAAAPAPAPPAPPAAAPAQPAARARQTPASTPTRPGAEPRPTATQPTARQPTTSEPTATPTVHRTASPPARRSRNRVPALAAALIAVLGIAGTAWSLARGPSDEPDSAANPSAVQLAASIDEGAATDAYRDAPHLAGAGSGADARPTAGGEAGGAGDGSGADTRAAGAAAEDSAADAEPIEVPAPPAPLDVAPVAPLTGMDFSVVEDRGGRGAVPLPLPAVASDADAGPGGDRPGGRVVYGVAQVDQAPALLNHARLERELRRRLARQAPGSQTAVALQFVVLASGRVDTASVQVVDGSSDLLREAAREVIGEAEFNPGRIAGGPVDVRVRMELVLAPE